ncbi:MAG: flagellar motor protein MotB [Verrucomicrobiae bacterium]
MNPTSDSPVKFAPAILLALVVALGGTAGYLFYKGGQDREELKSLAGRLTVLQKENGPLKIQVAALGKEKEAADAALSQERQKTESDRAAIAAAKQKAAEAQAGLEARKALEENLKKALESKDVVISQLEGRLKVNVASKIFFDSGSVDLLPGGQDLLNKLAAAVAAAGDQEIRVEGHTDDVAITGALRETYPSNWELSASRATSAVRYLEKSAAIPSGRLSAAGFANTRPVAPNDTEENRAKNRRIEIVLTPIRNN